MSIRSDAAGALLSRRMLAALTVLVLTVALTGCAQGADAVGMSTATEAVALHYMGVKLLGISCITDMAIENTEEPTTHEQVQAEASKAADSLEALVAGVVARIAA